MSIAAIAIVTNSLFTVPLALLYYSKPHSTDGTQVNVLCCMSIAAIAVVNNSLFAVPLALLHYSKPHSTDGTPVNV